MNVSYKYSIGDKVFYPWATGYRGMNNVLEVNEGEIQSMSIRKTAHGEIVKTVDFKGRNGILEEHISDKKEYVEQVIREDTTIYK